METAFLSEWVKVDGAHEMGRAIVKYTADNANTKITNLVHDLAVDLDVSSRKLWYTVQFYKMFPSLEDLPEGKNITWSKIILKYLSGESGQLPERPPKQRKNIPEDIHWRDYAKRYGCFVCGLVPAQNAHFPATAKAGAKEHWTVPMCQEHHSLYHTDPVTFYNTIMWDNLIRFMKTFYDYIEMVGGA